MARDYKSILHAHALVKADSALMQEWNGCPNSLPDGQKHKAYCSRSEDMFNLWLLVQTRANY